MRPADWERVMSARETGSGTKTMQGSQSGVSPAVGEANGESVLAAPPRALPSAGAAAAGPADSLPERRRAPRSPRAQLFVTISHWSMVVLLTLSLLSGMRIGWGYVESAAGRIHRRLGGDARRRRPEGHAVRRST